MATKWKIYAPAEDTKNSMNPQSTKWEDTEAADLNELARKASETARQSMKLINAAKAEACRQQLLREMKEAR